MFRSIDIGSPSGQQICSYTSKGQLVPDDLTVQIWKKTLDAYVALTTYKPREDILVLDGIPRNVAQTELVKDHIDILQVINLCCDDEEHMIMRMRRRAIRENRADDANEDVIRSRFNLFNTVLKASPRMLSRRDYLDRRGGRFASRSSSQDFTCGDSDPEYALSKRT